MTKFYWIQLICSFTGSLGFGGLFNVRGRKLWLCALGGMLCWALYLGLFTWTKHEVISSTLTSLLISLWALLLARRLKTPTIGLFVPAIVPLIPGGGLYYTALNAMQGNWRDCFSQGVSTLCIAAGIAVGMAAVSSVDVVIQSIKRRRHP